MKRLYLLSFVLIFSFFPSFAQQKADKSILWEISGKDLNEPSYLLGTFHMVCLADLKLDEKVLETIQKVQQVALEVNLTDPEEIASIQKLMFSDVTISSQLTVTELEEFRFLLQEEYNINLKSIDNLASFGLLGLLATKMVPCEVKGYDMEVLEKALSLNKTILGLEHFIDQIEIMTTLYPPKEILAQLKMEEDFEKNYQAMAKAFADEDITELYALATDATLMSKEAKKLLLDDRNEQWVIKMEKIMPTKTTLFAVGAGHLGGELGVIQLLKAKGYEVKAVLK
ncbi:TraB/GumN family protein [Myroides odoratus]|uniref:TraB/GumN family protein n=1 Tax=Myroides odoratus TaxID=256 RepID=UPI0039B0B215